MKFLEIIYASFENIGLIGWSLVFFFILNCSSASARALKNPIQNVCPNFGILDKNSVNSESLVMEDDIVISVGVKARSGKVIFLSLDYVFNALDLTTEHYYLEFKNLYSQICDGPIPFEDRIAINASKIESKRVIESLKNKNIREIISLIESTKDEKFQKELNVEKEKLLDLKVKKFLSDKFPFARKYLENNILLRDGDETNLKLFEVMRISVLGKNPKTGLKVLPVLYEKENRLVYLIQPSESDLGICIYFREYNGNLIVEKVTEKMNGIEKSMNPKVDQRMAYKLLSDGSDFPIDSFLDIELISKIR
ncbi:hypothetical protein [Leptospira stimsonii]|uniref:Uncharacterized protein n=1 Tax=Leptospira stimsonii TaxID=2202203 RepID=A0ABY2N382_9LEPT|nr:hypothetical protein [Leptospira stimsonii]TGK26078.1 hypothetical protein EHO98_00730 [Leptospira stimsonii]TGM14906.1 hypothetical protein EHQ90_10520 [Leptospira stimsonii]